MKINTAPQYPRVFTGQGGPASPPHIVGNLEALRRTVMACMLWEDNAYSDGQSVADRVKALVPTIDPFEVMELAVVAREDMKLRHAPLLLMRELARHPKKPKIAECLARVIQRADEITEFLAIYWKDGKDQPLSKQVKLGLAAAFQKFDEYALAKYNRDGEIKLRDALFLCHAKPADLPPNAVKWDRAARKNYKPGEGIGRVFTDREFLQGRLVNNALATPDTWEVALSAGADKKETFERLIQTNQLGYMALLRNLRNMREVGVSLDVVAPALLAGAAKSRALPFRFVAAARAVPAWEPVIDNAMQMAMASMAELPGRTTVLVDVSGSMDAKLSEKSDLTRMDAACALATLIRGICKDVRVFSFSTSTVEVPPRAGMALIDAIKRSQAHGGTYLGGAIEALRKNVATDRLIVITDEQSADVVGRPIGRGYMVNVASEKHGVGYGEWTHISGFSEAIVAFIQRLECPIAQ